MTDALKEWARTVGLEFATTRRDALAEAETATFATSQRIIGILQPGTLEEVQECVRIANRHGVPLYPISSGKNWGYGSRVPPNDRCALLDLSRLNRIVGFNEALGYVTVEPGVTQAQLYQFLRDKGSNLWMDATGSSPDCSLIGNALERGFGHTPMGDHFLHVCGLQVILPTGDVIETGAARFPGSTTAATSRWGVGPSLDGLFSQSNFGIVTRITIWLMPRPEAFEAFFFRGESADGLAPLIDTLRDLRMKDILRSSMHIANDYKVLGGIQQYPWDEMQGHTPIPPEKMADFRQKLTFGHWNASGGLYGTAIQVKDAKRLLRRALASQKGVLKFLNPKTLGFAKRYAGAFKLLFRWDVSRTIELVEPVVGLMQGVPTTSALASAYWRKRMNPPVVANPDGDRCGLLWYAPMASTEGVEVERLTSFTKEILLRHGFEPMISLTMISPRAVCCVISISYDREVSGEDDRANRCHDELVARCTSEGFYPYRLGIRSMEQIPQDANYERLLAALKGALDPRGVLAPGRYNPAKQRELIEA
jgi:4-cresol dehydrogenase (hydroxylating) flavoprotein subunit